MTTDYKPRCTNVSQIEEERIYTSLKRTLQQRGAIRRVSCDTGLNEKVLAQKCNSTAERHQLGFFEAIGLMRSMGDMSLLDTAKEIIEGTKTCSLDLMRASMKAVKENGDWLAMIDEAMEDDVIDHREEQEILREIREAKLALENVEAAVIEKSRSSRLKAVG